MRRFAIEDLDPYVAELFAAAEAGEEIIIVDDDGRAIFEASESRTIG